MNLGIPPATTRVLPGFMAPGGTTAHPFATSQPSATQGASGPAGQGLNRTGCSPSVAPFTWAEHGPGRDPRGRHPARTPGRESPCQVRQVRGSWT